MSDLSSLMPVDMNVGTVTRHASRKVVENGAPLGLERRSGLVCLGPRPEVFPHIVNADLILAHLVAFSPHGFAISPKPDPTRTFFFAIRSDLALWAGAALFMRSISSSNEGREERLDSGATNGPR